MVAENEIFRHKISELESLSNWDHLYAHLCSSLLKLLDSALENVYGA